MTEAAQPEAEKVFYVSVSTDVKGSLEPDVAALLMAHLLRKALGADVHVHTALIPGGERRFFASIPVTAANDEVKRRLAAHAAKQQEGEASS